MRFRTASSAPFVKEEDMQFSKLSKRFAAAIVCGTALLGNASGQPNAPILLHPRTTSDSLPVAAYRHIKRDDFRRLVIGAFHASGFSLTAISPAAHGMTAYNFSYAVPLGNEARNVTLVVTANENLDKNRRCANCFLRLADLHDAPLQKLPWMAQYEVSSRIFPAIDQAFAKVKADGQAFMNPGSVFNYRNQWKGERNLYQNAFAGIDLPGLKAATIGAYRAAGFTFVREEPADLTTTSSELVFSFPVDPDRTEGVVYKIVLASQLDARGACNTCETIEAYDPYQQLPAAGLSGMASRLTLESRFTAARALAFEKWEAATARYLRPGTEFFVPPKPAPLGSPRPRPLPPVVT
jgi:hypothetical protein